jgi:biopolymer transport protein ExbD
LINSFDKKVYLRPDARAKYGDVTRVIDQLQLSGVTSVAFLTEKRRTPPQHP